MFEDFTSFSNFTFKSRLQWESFKEKGGGEELKQILSTEWYEPLLSGLDTINVDIDLTKNIHNAKMPELVVLGIPLTYMNMIYNEVRFQFREMDRLNHLGHVKVQELPSNITTVRLNVNLLQVI